jgi:hypothetical protein
MNAKLTLKLQKNTVQKAKVYAHKHHQSLSKMVENYFEAVTTGEDGIPTEKDHPIVKELKGIASSLRNMNFKKEYADYLEKKYK